jgi:hypothetical protein
MRRVYACSVLREGPGDDCPVRIFARPNISASQSVIRAWHDHPMGDFSFRGTTSADLGSNSRFSLLLGGRRLKR